MNSYILIHNSKMSYICRLFNCFCLKKNIIVTEDELKDNIDECGICLEKLNENACLKTEGCNHIFHLSCYKEYLKYEKNINKGCPMCFTNQLYINNILLKN